MNPKIQYSFDNSKRLILLIFICVLVVQDVYSQALPRWQSFKKIYTYEKDTVLSLNSSRKIYSTYLNYTSNQKRLVLIDHLENENQFHYIGGICLDGNRGYHAWFYDKGYQALFSANNTVDPLKRYQLKFRKFEIYDSRKFASMKGVDSNEELNLSELGYIPANNYVFSFDTKVQGFDSLKQFVFRDYYFESIVACTPYYQSIDLYVENDVAYIFTLCGDSLHEYHLITNLDKLELVKQKTYLVPKFETKYNHLNVFYKMGLLYVQFGDKLYLLDRKKTEDYWLLLDKKARFPMTIEISGPFGEQTLLR